MQSPPYATGSIWIFEVDHSTSINHASPPRSFPVGGGSGSADVHTFVDILRPFHGEHGRQVIFAGQKAPSGWSGGYSKSGYLRFGAVTPGAEIGPGESVDLQMQTNRPPAIRKFTLIPDWVFVPSDSDSTGSEALEEAWDVERKARVHGYTLGPSDRGLGGLIHINTLRTDMARSAELGWVSNRLLLDELLTRLDEAISAMHGEDGRRAIADLEDLLDRFSGADTDDYSEEFVALVVLNVDALIANVETAPLPRDSTGSQTQPDRSE